jgi:hypothetical protein
MTRGPNRAVGESGTIRSSWIVGVAYWVAALPATRGQPQTSRAVRVEAP